MTDLLNGGNFDFLKEDAVQRSKQPVNLVVDNLSFSTHRMSIIKRIQTDLKAIAELIHDTGIALLDSLTLEQINTVLEDHRHIRWECPNSLVKMDMGLTGIYKHESKWVLKFDESGVSGEFELHDLNIQDVLGLLQTCENVLYTNKANSFKS